MVRINNIFRWVVEIGEEKYQSYGEICSLEECYADLFLQYYMEEKWFLHFFYVEGEDIIHLIKSKYGILKIKFL